MKGTFGNVIDFEIARLALARRKKRAFGNFQSIGELAARALTRLQPPGGARDNRHIPGSRGEPDRVGPGSAGQGKRRAPVAPISLGRAWGE